MKKFALCSILVANFLFATDLYTPKNYDRLIGMEGFGEPLLKMHFKLYQGYVKNSNELIAKLKNLSDSGQGSSIEFAELKRRFGWEFDGMRLHELYFENLGGDGKPSQSSNLMKAIVSQFGDFDQWKKDFISTGLMRGIGWAILYFDPEQNRLINCWINEHDVGHLATGAPILIMDVFEHAYITQYGLDRAKYIDAFFSNINWTVSASRYDLRAAPFCKRCK